MPSDPPDRADRPDDPAPDGWRDLTLPLPVLYRRAGRWSLVLAAVTMLPHVLLWGWPSAGQFGSLPSLLGTLVVYFVAGVAAYLVSAVIHEALHVLAMVTVAGVRLQDVSFGVRWREGVAYVHAAKPMTVRAYRVVLAVPGVVQGVLPAVFGLALGYGWFTVYGFVMLVSALGDWAMWQLLRPFDAATLVRDHPSLLGCQIQDGKGGRSK